MTPGVEDSQTDLHEVFGPLRRRWWLFVLLLLAVPGGVYLASVSTEKRYRASVTLQVQPEVVDTSLFSSGSQAAGDPGRALAASARRVETLATAISVSRRLPPPRNPRSLRKRVEVEVDPDAEFLTITAPSVSAVRAAQIANTYGEVLIEIRTQEAEARIDRATRDIEASLDRLRPSDRDGRRQLSEQLQRLRAIRAAQGSNVTLIERATPPTKASSPKPVRNTLAAIPLALLLAAGLTLLLERLNRRIRTPDELLRVSPVPMLTTVSSQAFRRVRPWQEDIESFHRLHTSLGYLTLDDPIRSVVVVSPGQGEGKSTVAVGLARAAARAENRVLLIDADLRRPQVRDRLDVVLGPAVDEVLTGRVSVDEAAFTIPGTNGRLHVLAARAVPHPWELVASTRMRALVTEQGRHFDLIVIDTPPVLAVSDALPLCECVDGVVVVARMGRTRRKALAQAIDVVALAHGNVVGVAATGVRKRQGYGGYGYGYAARVPDPEPVAERYDG